MCFPCYLVGDSILVLFLEYEVANLFKFRPEYILGLTPLSLLFVFSSITGILYICAPFLHTWNTQLFLLPSAFWSSFLLLHIALLYLITPQIYSGISLPLSLPLFYSCNFRPGVQTLCNPNILFFSFLLILPLIKQRHAFLWASHSWGSYIVVETLYYASIVVQN